MRGKLFAERGETTLPSYHDSIMLILLSLPWGYVRVLEQWSLLKNFSTGLLTLGIPCFFDLFLGTLANLWVLNSTLLGSDTLSVVQ